MNKMHLELNISNIQYYISFYEYVVNKFFCGQHFFHSIKRILSSTKKYVLHLKHLQYSRTIKARKDKIVAQLQHLICYHDHHYGDKTIANYSIIRINVHKSFKFFLRLSRVNKNYLWNIFFMFSNHEKCGKHIFFILYFISNYIFANKNALFV